MGRHVALIAALAAFCTLPYAALAAELPDPPVLRGWISDMKASDRGPFRRIRWFCNDGTVLPPKAYACVPHGGGVQHGEWSDRVRQLRAGGYQVANVLADLDVEALLAQPDHKRVVGQIMVEQFLIAADDGWILRKARFYRGALQDEDERAGARRLLLGLAADPAWTSGQGYLALRSAAGLLRHGEDSKSVAEVRRLSAALAERDAGFKTLRNKIHGHPEAGDAAKVRDYAAQLAGEAARADYERLAAAIDAVYAGGALREGLERLAGELPELGPRIAVQAARLAPDTGADERFAASAALMVLLRDGLASAATPAQRLAMLDASLALESEHFAAASALRGQLAGATRRQQLSWLATGAEAVYGTGLVSARQRAALAAAFGRLKENSASLRDYKESLDYLALVPGWSGQWQRFHFQDSVQRLAALEPLAELFTQDQLRGSPLFFYAQALDGLLRDANALAGLNKELFGEDVGAGLRSLNPGLARGRLTLAAGEAEAFKADGIYLLPETVADLPPVAGILTAGEGNPLSHVQLLARNLGIPNVAVDEALIAKLKPFEGKQVILAVSPAGAVRLTEDTGQGAEIFGQEQRGQDVLIRPDLEKLDLGQQDFLPLSGLRAADSGRTVGPKAAKLGELRHHYPEAVAEGLAIPFGAFRRLLDQPYGASGRSVFDWMVENYRALERLTAGSVERVEATEAFRAELQRWIETADPGADFRARLEAAMAEAFGPDGSYGVFVRSDTNVEDLPGFTGAGLNLTVPNVVGVEAVLAAIPRVWASPFSARAFAWRQALMDRPEHVYPAVLLLRSVPAEKSGVLVTQDIDSGRAGWLSVAVNEGVGGAVDGQAAESLRVDTASGEVKLLAQATATLRRRIDPAGGVAKIPVSGADQVLQPAEVAQLVTLAKELPRRFPAIVDAAGEPAPADIEFGFLGGALKLFQIRPFLDSAKAAGSAYLKSLDELRVDLTRVP
jgi:hypothetical protein